MSAALALKFREMVPDDADAVELVEKACFAIPWSRESFWREAANENTSYTLALDGDKVIGYAGCWISFEEAQITNVAILPEYRGRGAGTQLMAAAIRLSSAWCHGHDPGSAPLECTGPRALCPLRVPGSRHPARLLS